MKPEPSRLVPLFVPRIWGSRDLRPLFDGVPSTGDPIGEVWLTGEKCRFDSGPLQGRLLGEAWPSLSEEWTGARLRSLPRIPLLVKFIFPEDKLSVQVHPDDDYARQHEASAGGVGKTEMWYAVSARPDAQLRLGLERGVTREAFQLAIQDGTVERCLRRFDVRTGHAFFVPAGTAHTICAGMVLCEVQEHSDITYRVFDYNRLQANGQPRPLHIRQALDVMNFGTQRGGRVEPVVSQSGGLKLSYLAACPHFVVERWEFGESVGGTTSPDHFELLIVLAGQGRIGWGNETVNYNPGEVWFLPAALGTYSTAPNSPTTMLRTYVPDAETLAHPPAGRQIDKDAWSRLVNL